MKAAVIFHSVTGNDYLIAKRINDKLAQLKIQTNLYKIEDTNLLGLAEKFDPAKTYLDDIMQVKTATPELLIDNDLIILGSPTYYGNYSAKMMTFLEKTADCWPVCSLRGKIFFPFTSAACAEGASDLCLKMLIHYAHSMGMLNIPIPPMLVPGANISQFGIKHYCGPFGEIRPDEKSYKTIDKIIEYVANTAEKWIY
jgi:NAD(P)H dehydrogenase (quinone)